MAWTMILLAATSAGAADKSVPMGRVDIRSSLVGARVYFDDAYVGDADLFVEDVPAGSHMITMRQGSQRIFGQFTLKPGETLMLEGRFEENRIVDLKEIAREEAAKRAEAARQAESERKASEAERKAGEAEKKKKETDQAKKSEQKKSQKTATAAGAAAAVKVAKGPEEERRDLHANLIRADFTESPSTLEMTVVPKVNEKIITNFSDGKASTGKLMRTKQGQVICETGPCERDWTGRFFYVDESGKRDAFLIRWKETVFSGTTPQGTSKVVLDVCLNGNCRTLQRDGGEGLQNDVDRYVVAWSSKSFVIRRADIVKQITEAGGKVPNF